MNYEQTAIERLKEASEMSLLYYEKPLLITYSGGKDSDVCLELAKRSGIPFEIQHSHTTADAPETVYYIRRKFYELELQGIKAEITPPRYQGKPISMWSLIPIKKMPPTRIVRYCCSVLKETAGKNRAIVTGVRKVESVNRASRGILESYNSNIQKKIILNNDNDDRRKIIEHCQMQGKTICNPIVDFSDKVIWAFCHSELKEINPLYKCGFNRVGCIGCPMAGKKRYTEFARYPKYRGMYVKSFSRMIKHRTKSELDNEITWKTGTDVFHWWMEDGVLPGQLSIDGEDDW